MSHVELRHESCVSVEMREGTYAMIVKILLLIRMLSVGWMHETRRFVC